MEGTTVELLLLSRWVQRDELVTPHTMASTAEPVQLEQVILPWIEKKWKKKQKKAPNRKKEESASSCPSSSPSGSAYTAPPSWPTKLSGLGCAWAQSSMLFKQTNVQFEMPVALLCPS